MTAFQNLRRSFVQQIALMTLCSSLVLPAHAQAPTEMTTPAAIVLGPPMWQVSNDTHSLWIFGILTPLETGLQWHSDQVASVIEKAQEYIYIKPPETKIPINPFKIINGLRLVFKIRNNPDGKTLEEVIPADLYARLSKLLKIYAIDDMDKVRPYYAADNLRGWAVILNKLTEDHGVDLQIEKLLSNNTSIKLTPIKMGPEFLDYEFLKDSAEKMASGVTLADEIHCLKVSVDNIENDIDEMQARAKAWAEGNVSALRKGHNFVNANSVCSQVLMNLDGINGLTEDTELNWLHAAENALLNNKTSFAVLEMDQLLNPDGLLEKLREKGYTIREP